MSGFADAMAGVFTQGLGSFVGSAASGLGSLITGGYGKQKRLQSRQYEFQRLLNEQMADINRSAADKAYERQLDFWNKQNLYNSPANQAKLREAAGLNPYALNGTLGGAGVSGGLPSINPGLSSTGGSVSGSFAPSPLGSLPSIQLLSSQKRVLETQADKNEAEAGLTEYRKNVAEPALASLRQSEEALARSNVKNTDIRNALAELQLAFDRESYPDRLDSVRYEAEQLNLGVRKLCIGIQLDKAELERQPDVARLLKVNVAKASAEVAYLDAKRRFTEKGIELEDAQIKELLDRAALERSGVSRNLSEVGKNSLEQELLRKNLDFYTADKVAGYVSSLVDAALRLYSTNASITSSLLVR